MNKNAHDTDDFFKDAYRQFKEEPSADVWRKINADLDRKDAVSNRKKFIFLRIIAMALLLLLGGFLLFNPGIFRTNSGSSKDKSLIANIVKKSSGPQLPVKRKEINDGSSAVAKEIVLQEEDPIENANTENNLSLNQNGIASERANQAAYTKKIDHKKTIDNNALPNNKQFAPGITGTNRPENTNYYREKNESLPEENITVIPLNKRGSTGNQLTKLTKIERPILLPSTGDFILKNNNAKIKNKGKKNSFVPYWLVTFSTSYERAGYRLDSDLPTYISSIKHRESHEPSFSMRVLATRLLTKYWGLQTGLIYYNTAIGISPQKLYALQNPDGYISFKYITSSGFAYIKQGLGATPAIGDSLITTEGKHSLKSISVPLIIKYSVEKNNFTFTPGIGIEANFLTSAKVEIEVESPASPEIIFINKLDGAKKFYTSVVADAEIRYKLNSKLSVNLRPAIRFALSPITENNVVETFPLSTGVGIGLTLKF